MFYENKLTIVVPTYNHPTYVQYLLTLYEKVLEKFNIILEIHDSSTNNETQKMCLNANEKVKYVHYDDIDVDEKTILCLKNVNTEYAFLCGDGFVLDLDKTFDHIYSCMQERPDIIEMFDMGIETHKKFFERKFVNDTKIYDIGFFASSCFWHVAFYGGSIISKKIIDKFEITKLKKVIGTGFIYPVAVFDNVADDNNRFFAYVISDNFLITNPHKKEPMWVTNKTGLKIWTYNFCSAVETLPFLYNESKKEIIETVGLNTNYFTFNGLCAWRITRNLNLLLTVRYRRYLKEMSNVKYFTILIISLMPPFLLKMVKIIRRKVKCL